MKNSKIFQKPRTQKKKAEEFWKTKKFKIFEFLKFKPWNVFAGAREFFPDHRPLRVEMRQYQVPFCLI